MCCSYMYIASEPLFVWAFVTYAGELMPSDQSELECGEELDQCPGDSGDGVG